MARSVVASLGQQVTEARRAEEQEQAARIERMETGLQQQPAALPEVLPHEPRAVPNRTVLARHHQAVTLNEHVTPLHPDQLRDLPPPPEGSFWVSFRSNIVLNTDDPPLLYSLHASSTLALIQREAALFRAYPQ